MNITREFLIEYFKNNPEAEYRDEETETTVYGIEVDEKKSIIRYRFRDNEEGNNYLGDKTSFSMDQLLSNFETIEREDHGDRSAFPIEKVMMKEMEKYRREKIANNLSIV